jgi:Winged helix DNA-binding domain
VARRFLAAYGPATPEQFARWWGGKPAAAKRLFRAMGDELSPVKVEGWCGWSLTSMLEEPVAKGASERVLLLPAFDPYTVALCRHPAVLDAAQLARVSRPQGWISPVVLRGGRIVGTWEHETKGGRTSVTVALFAPADPEVRERIGAEAARLGQFLGTTTNLRFA